MALLFFGRSVNPMPTKREGQIMSISTPPPQIFNPPYGPDVYHQIAPDNPLLCLSWLAYKYELKLYIPGTLNIALILWHITFDCVCGKMLNMVHCGGFTTY